MIFPGEHVNRCFQTCCSPESFHTLSRCSRENHKFGIQVQYFSLIPFPKFLNVVPGYNTQMPTHEAGLIKTIIFFIRKVYTQLITSLVLATGSPNNYTLVWAFFYFSFLGNLTILSWFKCNGNWENHTYQWPLKDQRLILELGRTFFPTNYTTRKNPERFLSVPIHFFPTTFPSPVCLFLFPSGCKFTASGY